MGAFLLIKFELALVVGHHRGYPEMSMVIDRRCCQTLHNDPAFDKSQCTKDLAFMQASSHNHVGQDDHLTRMYSLLHWRYIDQLIKKEGANGSARSRRDIIAHRTRDPRCLSEFLSQAPCLIQLFCRNLGLTLSQRLPLLLLPYIRSICASKALFIDIYLLILSKFQLFNYEKM